MKNYKTIIILIFFIFLSCINVYSQSKQFYIKTFGALQKTDERIVGLPYYLVDDFKAINEELGFELTKHYGIELGGKLFSVKRFLIAGGLNFSYEWNNYFRPYNWHSLIPEGVSVTNVAKALDINKYYLIGSSLNVNYILISGKRYFLKSGINISSYFRIKSYYRDTRKQQFDTYNKFIFHSFEFNPFLGFEYRGFEIDFYYRLFQIKKVDRALFVKRSTLEVGLENDYETYNLPKLGVSIKYWFNLFDVSKKQVDFKK